MNGLYPIVRRVRRPLVPVAVGLGEQGTTGHQDHGTTGPAPGVTPVASGTVVAARSESTPYQRGGAVEREAARVVAATDGLGAPGAPRKRKGR